MSWAKGWLPTVTRRTRRQFLDLHQEWAEQRPLELEAARVEASLSIWVMFVTFIFLTFLLGVANLTIKERLDLANQEAAALRARVTLLEERWETVSGDLANWHKWLELREAGWGSAHFVRLKPEPEAQVDE